MVADILGFRLPAFILLCAGIGTNILCVSMLPSIEYVAVGLFFIAILHTFLAGRFRALATRYPEGSIRENLLHLLGETEVVFLIWAAVLFISLAAARGWHEAIEHIERLDYTEPKFVFVIMVIAATRPVIEIVDAIIRTSARLLAAVTPLSGASAFLFAALTIGPLMGSLVTEPAAMTVIALVLRRQFFERSISERLMYAILGTLFVGVSIGGVLTNFAAPPVLMVAKAWQWSNMFMFTHFGIKSIVILVVSALALITIFAKELGTISILSDSDAHDGDAAAMPVPLWVTAIHVAALAFAVATSHHSDVCLGGFIVFLGFCTVTNEFQEPLKLRESLLVGGFLAGLVTLGSMQDLWLRPLLASLGEFSLFLGCTLLTAVTDNAALTYLGSQVEGLAENMRYFLVAGAITGGGLTVIANAPNPAGYAILSPTFAKHGGGISSLKLFAGALPATLLAFFTFWFL